ncbi:ATP-binding protein [Chryseobacterium sp. CH21]|uniref:ATP-binding protein n=1 Tax=Chryseobacterium sp. CH21 TaxID=713556 RepID=UPI0039774F1D
MLTAIIHNILDNAVKNTFEGSIILNITENQQKSTIIITDTGIGMSAEQIDIYMNLFRILHWKPLVSREKDLAFIWLSIW